MSRASSPWLRLIRPDDATHFVLIGGSHGELGNFAAYTHTGILILDKHCTNFNETKTPASSSHEMGPVEMKSDDMR